MFLAFYPTLNSGIVNFADFLRIESSPFLVVKSLIKLLNIFNVNKIDKSIPNIAVVEEIYRQIEEVELVLELLVQSQ